MPALNWEAMLDALDIEMRSNILDEVKRLDSTVSKALVKSAIEAAVPNCQKLLKNAPPLLPRPSSTPPRLLRLAGTRCCRSLYAEMPRNLVLSGDPAFQKYEVKSASEKQIMADRRRVASLRKSFSNLIKIFMMLFELDA